MRRTLTSLMVLTLAMTPGVAAAQTALSLTLDEAIRMGVAHDPRLAEARARDAAAADGVASNAALKKPTVTAIGRLPADEPRARVRVRPAGGTFNVIFPDVPDNYRFRTEMDVPIYTAAAWTRSSRPHAPSSTRARPISRAGEQDVRLDITRAYWGLVTARESVRVLEQALDRADAYVGDVKSRVDAGVLPPNDLLSAQAQRARRIGAADSGDATTPRSRRSRWAGCSASARMRRSRRRRASTSRSPGASDLADQTAGRARVEPAARSGASGSA